jgi:hypothetical protein
MKLAAPPPGGLGAAIVEAQAGVPLALDSLSAE